MPTAQTSRKKKAAPQKRSQKVKFDEIIHKNWPKARKEMEKGIQEAKKLINQGERHLSTLTDKSAKHLRVVVLNHRKDKHYHNLGKLVASIPKDQLGSNNRIDDELYEIDQIDAEIKKIERELKNKK